MLKVGDTVKRSQEFYDSSGPGSEGYVGVIASIELDSDGDWMIGFDGGEPNWCAINYSLVVPADEVPVTRVPGDLLFDDTTTMVTDEASGAKKGQKICRYDLIPAEALAEVAALYGKGASKYAERNWEGGNRFSLNFGAMMRHAWRFWRGEDFDPETGVHHMSCVVFHAFAIMTFQARNVGTDDRTCTK